ncbi:MAG: patatin-like phospholipase family protein [Ignavibacterium sp.]|jgi:NTE family protein
MTSRILVFVLPFLSLPAAGTFESFAFQNGNPVRSWVIRPDLENSSSHGPLLVPHRELKRPKIGIALSGGGARGIASIGVLEAFEEAGVPIDFIAGTSIGSIIGGLYAAGFSTEQLRALVDSTDWEALLSLGSDARRRDLFYDQKLADDKSILVLRFDGFQPVLPEAFSTGQRLTQYLNVLVLRSVYHTAETFDDLKIPFRAVATDLVSGKRVVLGTGDLTEALRASVTVPLLFSPVRRDTSQLLDGGLTSNIPADVARTWGADVVVAVDVTSPLRSASELNAPWEIADQIIGIAMQFANQEQLENADYVIRPGIGSHLSTDFTELDTLIQRGKESARPVVAAIKSALDRARPDEERTYQPARLVERVAQNSSSWVQIPPALQGPSVALSDVRAFLNEMHESGDFKNVEIQVNEFADSTLFVIVAEPYPVLNDVVFQGNQVVSSETLRSVFDDLLGREINAHTARSALEGVIDLYRQGGYSLARILSARLDSAGTAIITLDEGIVDRRTIVGTRKTKDYVIWRELPWNEREVFRVDKVAEGLDNLYGTNLFEQVSIKAKRVNDEQIVVIDARERNTGLIRLGMTVDNERNIQPSIDVRDENFLGIASELGLHFFGGLRNRLYLGEFKANRIFNSYLTFNIRGYYDLRDINVFKDEFRSTTRWDRVRTGEYREVRGGVSVSFGTQLERLGQFTVEGRTERQRLWSIFGTPVDTARRLMVTSLKLGTRIDSRDRFPYPRDGVVMEFTYESGLVKEKGEIGFTKMFFNYESYATLFPGQTIKPKIMFGFGDETLPLTEQFTLGGRESFFGYREDNARGRQLFLLSLAYRYEVPLELLFDTYLLARYDLGHIWEKAEQIRLKDLRHGIGIGVGLDTPIGPAEVFVGRAFFIRKDLFESPLSFGPVVTYFRIGYAF